jgi:hypothetical protein
VANVYVPLQLAPSSFAQPIVPKRSSNFSTINLGATTSAQVEQQVLEQVGSYGGQLGRVSEVLDRVIQKLSLLDGKELSEGDRAPCRSSSERSRQYGRSSRAAGRRPRRPRRRTATRPPCALSHVGPRRTSISMTRPSVRARQMRDAQPPSRPPQPARDALESSPRRCRNTGRPHLRAAASLTVGMYIVTTRSSMRTGVRGKARPACIRGRVEQHRANVPARNCSSRPG